MQVQDSTQAPATSRFFQPASSSLKYGRRPNSEEFEVVSNVVIGRTVVLVHREHVASAVTTAGAIVLSGGVVVGAGVEALASAILAFKHEGMAKAMAQVSQHRIEVPISLVVVHRDRLHHRIE